MVRYWQLIVFSLAGIPLMISLGCGQTRKRPQDGQQPDWERQRFRMVADQIEQRGIEDPAVLAALRKVPRHLFVPLELQARAYDDGPLPIGQSQTISQPYIVALMTELAVVNPNSVVLEIGTGSGYQAAVLAELVKKVYSIEYLELLGTAARARLKQMNYINVEVLVGDGYMGWPGPIEFDAILVTAAIDHVPAPLARQLKPGGRLVVPVGEIGDVQWLTVYQKKLDGTLTTHRSIPVQFVPFVGPEINRQTR
jgi:protein-L-isoaspartate(D-aspartate) O-methyltransferase